MATCYTFLLARLLAQLSTCANCAKMDGKELCIPYLLSLHPDTLFYCLSLGQDVNPMHQRHMKQSMLV